ncbi:MAG: response regulator [Myxococcales bacterium]|nr:response regulator [Myxococcales bacterium]HRC57646.1 response regulator [Kofleriaceae bacterium]
MATILIVDDAHTDRELLNRTVTSMGHRTIIAENGAQALTAAKTNRPTLILLDVVMPQMDGFATCRALKKDPDTQTIPVVLVTSKNNESDRFWGRKQGADDHVGKPWTKESIEVVVKRYCG